MSVKVVTVGAGGYATAYTTPLLENLNNKEYDYEYSGVVEINIEACPQCEEFKKNNIPVYTTLEEYFEHNTTDLVIVSTPPHLHAPQSIYAMEHGANVLCEKPIAPDFESAKKMLEVSEKTGKFLAIGFQFCYAEEYLSLKKDILDGVFGKPELFKGFVMWLRNWDYYGSGRGWGGRIKDDKGNLVLDSVVSNATAHYINQLLFLLGKGIDEAIIPKKITAELIRANKIENFDTCVLHAETEDGAKIQFVASHATDEYVNPIMEMKFEKATVKFATGGEIVAEFNDGTIKKYGAPDATISGRRRLWMAIDSVTSHEKLPCVAKTALSHNIIVNKLYECASINQCPQEIVINDEEKKATYIKDMNILLRKAYEQEKLLSELGEDWIKPSSFTIE